MNTESPNISTISDEEYRQWLLKKGHYVEANGTVYLLHEHDKNVRKVAEAELKKS